MSSPSASQQGTQRGAAHSSTMGEPRRRALIVFGEERAVSPSLERNGWHVCECGLGATCKRATHHQEGRRRVLDVVKQNDVLFVLIAPRTSSRCATTPPVIVFWKLLIASEIVGFLEPPRLSRLEARVGLCHSVASRHLPVRYDTSPAHHYEDRTCSGVRRGSATRCVTSGKPHARTSAPRDDGLEIC